MVRARARVHVLGEVHVEHRTGREGEAWWCLGEEGVFLVTDRKGAPSALVPTMGLLAQPPWPLRVGRATGGCNAGKGPRV